MGEIVIDIQDIVKKFGTETALDHVTLKIERGKIYGIIGRNGSGKSVLFKCICGLLIPDAGVLTIYERHIGAIIEEPGFLKQYSGFQNLKILSQLTGRTDIDIKGIMKLVGLEHAEKKKVGKYSMGMKQRLAIAQAIMEGQRLLILDEPMNGLDNQGVDEMRRLFLKLIDQGATILLASHNREDIETLCDEVYEMDHGIIKRSY